MTDPRKERKILIAVGIFVALMGALALISLIFMIRDKRGVPKETQTRIEVSRQVFVDTICFYQPIPRDSIVVRYETHRLPLASNQEEEGPPDTVDVQIPITQKAYSDSTFTAWVSGYQPQLDSIRVYPKTEVLTIRETITEKARQKRWGISVGAGATLNTKGEVQPGLFLGVSYTIVPF